MLICTAKINKYERIAFSLMKGKALLISGVNYFSAVRYFALKTRNLRTLSNHQFPELQHECSIFSYTGVSH